MLRPARCGTRAIAPLKTLARASERAEILGRLRTVRPDSARRWGRMSAHQMVCHLADNCRMMLGRTPVASRSGLLQRTLLKWFVLYAPVPWPHGAPTSLELDQLQGGGTRPGDFAANVASVEALLSEITAPARTLDRQAHPVFGPMSDADWLRMAYLHTDHHLRQFGA
jgi:hypothetical protein